MCNDPAHALLGKLAGSLAAVLALSRAGRDRLRTDAHAATRVGRRSGRPQLQLVLPLTADLAGLERFATAVTTPGSPAVRPLRVDR